MNLSPIEKNAVNAIEILLQLSKVRVTKQTIKNKLWQHPDFPSLASLSDTLNELNIANMATRLTSDHLVDIPLPALAYLQIEGGIFAPIRAISNNTVEWLDSKRGWQKESMARFDQMWDGVTLLIEPNEQSGEVDYNKKRRLEIIESFRYPFAWLGLLICLGFIIALSSQNYPLKDIGKMYTLMGLKISGFVASGFLVWLSIDSNNSFLSRICHLNSKTNCRNLLNSKAAKLFNWLSWSEVGFFYFFGGLLTLLISVSIPSASALQYLLLINCLALPYTIYSIYYQVFVAKEWCLFCTSIQIILWLEFIVGLTLGLPSSLQVSGESIIVLILSFLILPSLWALMKPMLQKTRQFTKINKEFNKIKFDPYYVRGLLDKQKILPPVFEGVQVPTMGNPGADHTLLVVVNPVCNSCAKTHEEIELLLNTTSDIKCQFILVASQVPGAESGIILRRILGLPVTMMPQALCKWFKALNLKDWNKKIKELAEVEDGVKQLNLHLRWCELAEVNKTPAIFFNNIELTNLYSIENIGRLSDIFTYNEVAQNT